MNEIAEVLALLGDLFVELMTWILREYHFIVEQTTELVIHFLEARLKFAHVAQWSKISDRQGRLN